MRHYFIVPLIAFLLFIVSPAFAETVSFTKEYTYQASELDSKATCRAIALETLKKQLLEELGTYLVSETEVKGFQLSRDQVTVFTAGIVSTDVLQEKWDGERYYLKARISADPSEVAKSLDKIRKDREKSKELEDSSKKADEALREIEQLKKEIADLKENR